MKTRLLLQLRDTITFMLKKLTFRHKIFLSQLTVFILFMLFLLPFGHHLVNQMTRNALEGSATELIRDLKEKRSEKEMIDYLKMNERFVFYRVSLLNNRSELIYDTHLARHLGDAFEENYVRSYSEVVEAYKTGKAYTIKWSNLFQADFAYVALRFELDGQPYVLRTAFPFAQLQTMSRHFQLAFFTLDIVFLLLFSLSTWFIFTRLSQPIEEIIQVIKPYQESAVDQIPHIVLKKKVDEDFFRLAQTLNSLSQKVQSQIQCAIEERNEKEAILESLVEGVIAVDTAGITRYINQTGTRMLGIPKRVLLGNQLQVSPNNTNQPLLLKCISLLKAARLSDKVVTDSITFGTAQKTYLDLIAVPKSSQSGAILVIQDKSSDHRIIEMGKDFIANASHELRTPITVIKGFAETLQDIPDISRSMLVDIIEKIVRNCDRMDQLVRNLLTLADIENVPETRFQEIDVEVVVDNCVHMLHALYPHAITNIKKEDDILIIPADSGLLELAILNLLNNAAKYSSAQAQIEIVLKKNGDGVQIDIQDQGMGIPAEDINHIFDRFYTVNKAHTRRLGGAGLGLSIVKTIIEKHEGSVSVFSELGKGSKFSLILPCFRNSQINTL